MQACHFIIFFKVMVLPALWERNYFHFLDREIEGAMCSGAHSKLATVLGFAETKMN